MRRRSFELLYAFLTTVLIALLYLVVATRLESVPAAGSLFGHGLGIAGFLLMLMTETLYSLRKRSRAARWGRTSSWLRFHIFTGLVGPFMVLLHTSWQFNGLAGIVTLFTIVVVISGFIGRYIYTAVPRTVDGVEIQAAELEQEISAAEADLQRWLAERPASSQTLAQGLDALPAIPQEGLLLVLGRVLLDWGYRWQWWRKRRHLDGTARAQAKELERLLRRRRLLSRQVASLAQARRLLATWHAVHIPIGMVLFSAAAIHIGAAIYYATLLK